MTDGEKALKELGFEFDDTAYFYVSDKPFVYINGDFCIGFEKLNKKLYTVSAFSCSSGEALDLTEMMLKAMLLRLQELNQAVKGESIC